MASRFLFASNNLIKSFNKLSLTHRIASNFGRCDLPSKNLLDSHFPILNSVRHTSFFNKRKFNL